MFLDRQYKKYIIENTNLVESGDFSYKLAPLWEVTSNDKEDKADLNGINCKDNQYFSYTDLAHSIFSATGIAITGSRKPVFSIILGQKKPIPLGDYWHSKPHIHITKHTGQQETSKKNEKKFSHSYGWILARMVGKDRDQGKSYLPIDARPFNDFAAYIKYFGSLWVWSNLGLRREKPWELPHDNHLIFENQPKVELLEYGYMLHRRLISLISNYKSSAAILKSQQDLIDLKIDMRETGVYGETRDLLIDGWNDMGVPFLQEQISDSLLLRYAKESSFEEKRTIRLELILTIAFGLFAAPILAVEIIEPLWKVLMLWKPSDLNLAKLYFNLIAILSVSFVLTISSLVLYKKKSDKN
jgi:hypothetical protein